MGEFVWGAATAHTGAMMREPKGDPTDNQRAERVFQAFRDLSASLKASRPDVLVMIATDHFHTFEYGNLPVFAIGTGDSFEGWGEFGTPKRDYTGVAEFGAEIHQRMVHAGFDAVGARDMMLDHAFSCPLQLLLDGWDAKILPIYVNCTIEPLPTIRRCLEFGRALGRAIREQTVSQRVAIIGTGGLSHWVGMPQTGQINSEFDRRFLERFEVAELDALADWDSDEVIRTAGNGAAEIRNWIMAAAAIEARQAKVLAYEPVEAWVTGIGVTELIP